MWLREVLAACQSDELGLVMAEAGQIAKAGNIMSILWNTFGVWNLFGNLMQWTWLWK